MHQQISYLAKTDNVCLVCFDEDTQCSKIIMSVKIDKMLHIQLQRKAAWSFSPLVCSREKC